MCLLTIRNWVELECNVSVNDNKLGISGFILDLSFVLCRVQQPGLYCDG